MSERQWKRLDAAERVEQRLLSNTEAAALLGLSTRQMRRLRRRVDELGAAGVIHGNAGRAPAHRVPDQIRARIVQLRLGKYAGFNDQHFTEKLAEHEGLGLSRATVRRVVRAAGIASTRQRRAPRHRRRRRRKARAGLMLLWDGSEHPWLEQRGPALCLMGALDDATGELLPGAHFTTKECAAGYLTVLKEIVRHKGLPWSIYMDHHSSLHRNDDHWTQAELQRGAQEPTQVGRALRALDITPIYALSPQGKGRVERLWRTLQDRLVSELRLQNACSLKAAHTVLQDFIPDFNRRFAVCAARPQPAWRKLRKQVDLERVCSFGYQSTVLNDNTVRLNRVVIDIAPGPQQCSYAHARVEVRQLLDGSWRVYHRDQLIASAPATSRAELRALKGPYHQAPRTSAALKKSPSAQASLPGRATCISGRTRPWRKRQCTPKPPHPHHP